MTDPLQDDSRSVLGPVLEGAVPLVVLVYRSEICRELFLGAAGAVEEPLEVTAMLDGALALERVAEQDRERVIGLFIETDRALGAAEVDRFRSAFPWLLRTVALLRAPDDGGEDSPAHEVEILCIGDSVVSRAGPRIDRCTRLLRETALRAQSLAATGDAMTLLTDVANREQLARTSSVVLRLLGRALQAEVALIEDIAGDRVEHPIELSTATGEGLLDALRAIALTQHWARQVDSQSAEELAFSEFLTRTGTGTWGTGIQLCDFVSATQGKTPFWLCLVYSLNGALASACGISLPERPVVPRSIALGLLRHFIATWARAAEGVFMLTLRERERAAAEERSRNREDAIAEMVMGIAHEVNTPLGIIGTATSVLEATLQGGTLREVVPETSRDLVDDISDACTMIQDNAQRLDELVRRFKQVSVSQRVEKISEVSVRDVIGEAISARAVDEESGELQVSTVFDVDPGCETWRGYPAQLTEVLGHLLDNAARHGYRGQGGTVEVRLRARDVDGRRNFSLSLTDRGAGIALEDQSRIFDAFFTTARSTRSVGLGLALVHNIVTHGLRGEIRCESAPTGGTTFYVDFSSF